MREANRLELREELAAYAHEAWSGWMKYMFAKFEDVTRWGEESVQLDIPVELYDRWIFQMSTPYSELPEDMKPSDRDEADKMIAIFSQARWKHDE